MDEDDFQGAECPGNKMDQIYRAGTPGTIGQKIDLRAGSHKSARVAARYGVGDSWGRLNAFWDATDTCVTYLLCFTKIYQLNPQP